MIQPWTINLLTLFPHLFPGPLSESVIGRAFEKKLWQMNTHNIRDYAIDKHRTVDDTSYGGGNGMVLRADVLTNAITHTFSCDLPIIYLSPRGHLFNQQMARELVRKHEGINVLCGRFEGIDERIIEKFNIIEISIGDYVLSSGDIAAYVLLDSCIRNIPGVLPFALNEESFGDSVEYQGLLEYPQYTKPAIFEGVSIPEILLSGNHKMIAQWRLEQAKEKTFKMRKDLWCKYTKDNL